VKEMLSSWKSIAVFLDDTPKGERIGKCAAALAYRCGAHLIGIHGMSCNPAEHPSDSFACGKEAIHSVFARLQAAEEQKALAVDCLFTALSLKQGVSAGFRMIRSYRADDRLIPYAKKARTHSDAQIAAIAASIKEWGWTTPALVGEDGGLIAGHARILAARQLGIGSTQTKPTGRGARCRAAL
jgi:hypothetical protein